MAGVLKTWFGRRRRNCESNAPAAASARPVQGCERHTARALARDLDDALTRKQWNLAEHIANAAMRLPHEVRRSVGLCERVARLRALQGEAETAIAILDASGLQSSSQRLLRATCLLRLGRRDEAHLELRQWASRSSAPVSARSMLALLEWHGGDVQSACDALRLNLRQFEDPGTLALLMLIHDSKGHHEQAARWAERLRQACAFSPEAPLFNRMLTSIGREPARLAEIEPDQTQIETLTLELIAGEAAIPALVDAQRIQPQPTVARLLVTAIERALPELEDRAAAHLAMVELKFAIGDEHGALDCAVRGIRECPMSATLTRRAGELKALIEHAASNGAGENYHQMETERAA